MGPRRDNLNNKLSSSKRQEREDRQQEKKARDKKTYLRKDDTAPAFNQQLRAFNLQLRDIVGDGNCLFRSFADQMDGDQHRHASYRKKICDYMDNNREDFEPFIVDQTFDAFVRSLSKDGTYGGNECIVAFSRLFDAKICIHQLNQPVWIVCFSDPPKHEIHISYHNYEHYSSVRSLGDQASTSANIRQSMTTCDPSSINEKNKKTTKEKSNGACATDSEELFNEYDVEYINSQLTNPVDLQLIRDTLTDKYGDIDETIAHLLALDIPSSPQPVIIPEEESNESIEKIMSITNIYNVELVQQSYTRNNHDIDSTVQALLALTIDDNKTSETFSDVETIEDDEKENKSKTKNNRSVPNRQLKLEKKKAKKQRATEKHRAQVITTTGKTSTKLKEEKVNPPDNNEQENVPLANMEFINI
ncbi:unnamed protein product [Adineta steineri]|uniref:OTU domain-containing protein n=1 Tax=Adineta steineri TaxID=433720 RepID=A0A814UHR7_9BILA|nr:unnamed protein product [Adineta steineri]